MGSEPPHFGALLPCHALEQWVSDNMRMETPELSGPESGLGRRMRAIAVAMDDIAVGEDAIMAARAEVESLTVDDLESLADMHLLFIDGAPTDVMVDFWLRKRLAKERLSQLKGCPRQGPDLLAGSGAAAGVFF